MWRYLAVLVPAVLLSAGTVEAQNSIGVTAVIMEPFSAPSEVRLEMVRGELRTLAPTPASRGSRILITMHFDGVAEAPGAVDTTDTSHPFESGAEPRVPVEWTSAVGGSGTGIRWGPSFVDVVRLGFGVSGPRVMVTRVYASNS